MRKDFARKVLGLALSAVMITVMFAAYGGLGYAVEKADANADSGVSSDLVAGASAEPADDEQAESTKVASVANSEAKANRKKKDSPATLGAPITNVADIDSVADLAQAVGDVAASGVVLRLTPLFAVDMSTAGTASLNYSHNFDFTIDGTAAGAMITPSGRHFAISNTGTGTLTLKGAGLDGAGANGGIDLKTGGSFRIENSSLDSIDTGGNTGALHGGLKVVVKNSIFKNNKSRAIIAPQGSSYTVESCSFIGNSKTVSAYDQAGGIVLCGASSQAGATSHIIKDCYFDNNVLTASGVNQFVRGAAVHASTGYFSLSISGSIFRGNRVVGTSANHGANNRLDGGAVCVDGEWSQDVRFSLTDSLFEENFAQDDGGAVIVLGAQTSTKIKSSIRNCTFTGNSIAGAQYGRSIGLISVWVTDGCGGAISYFGLTESDITHCTFYDNSITDALTGSGTSLGSVGGGGAVGVDTGELVTDINQMPPCPVLSNNIFVGNKTLHPASKEAINLVNSVTNNALGNITERSKTGNVFVLPLTDRDLQTSQPDPRGLANNGNIGYDNRSTYYNNNGVSLTGIPVASPEGGTIDIPISPETVFASTTGSGEAAVPDKEYYGAPVGATGETARRFCYIPSPLSDEMYRDGSGPYYDADVRQDTRGYTRDHYPNAGAVEIYWTKFDPGVAEGGEWIGNRIDFNALGGIQSQLSPHIYYLVTAPSPDDKLTTFPRSMFELGNSVHNTNPTDMYTDYGFYCWRSNHPLTPGGTDFEEVQPNREVVSTKQTYTAIWKKNEFRVDFDLMYDVGSGAAAQHQWGTPLTGIPAASTISKTSIPDPVRSGYDFDGWYKDETLTAKWNFATDRVTTDTVLYAKWVRLCEYKVEHILVSSSGKSIARTETLTARVGSKAIADILIFPGHTVNPQYPGYTLEGIVKEDGSLVLKIYYEIDKFTVTFRDWNGKVLDSQTVEWGGDAVAPANPTRKGYDFVGWDRAESSWKNVKADVTLTAKYKAKEDSGTGEDEDENKEPGDGDGGNKGSGDGSGDGKEPGDGGEPGGGDFGGGNNNGGSQNGGALQQPPVTETAETGSDTDTPAVDGSQTDTNPSQNGGNSGETFIDGDETPRANSGKGDSPDRGSWALVNLLLAAISLICAILILLYAILSHGRRDSSLSVWGVVCAAAAVASLIVFFLTENMRLPVAMTDKWTILHMLLFAAAALSAMWYYIKDRNYRDSEREYVNE